MAKKLLKYFLLLISIFFIGRLLLFTIYFDNFKNSGVDYWLTFIYGLRMDTIAASILLVIPLIFLSFTPARFKKFTNIFLKYYFLAIFSLVIYIENATFSFVAQYDVRPNYLFVEYLIYPREVFAMIFADYKVELFIAFGMIGAFIYFYLKFAKDDFLKIFDTLYIKRVAMFLPILLLLFIGVRSSFGHRPANISDAMYSTNRMINEITKNSLHSIGYAIYSNLVHEGGEVKQYGKMDTNEALQRVKKRLNIESDDKESIFSRVEKSHFKSDKSKNLVIFVQESLGYQFVSAVGGEDGITPNFNRLSKEAILFKDLYSNGTRSVRGLAAVSAGNLAVPGVGVLKRNKSQSNFFTVASALKPFGYHTSFIYGGESRFDNMRSWYSGNGFNEIIDQPQFENPTFVAPWGVCDEDLVVKANEEFKNMYAKNQKFATVMFSQSNHSPFEFPCEKIELLKDVPPNSVKNAIKYADHAIGRLFELAKKEPYYKDTIFVVIADHNVRVYGDDMVPVDMFHIPAIIVGDGIKPMIYDKIASQPDVLATALDLIGLDLKYPIMGHSIFSDKKQNISLMQFHSSYALRVDDKVAIIRPGQKPLTFSYKDPETYLDTKNHLTPIENDEELQQDALAFVITLDHMYNKKLYR
ncbi:LTA synthase family protein [Sulfurimonas sp.]|jgi:phosphoglycerol transferase MdoB-like AlkP superfamily enzyme|uniref:LTA synthase family protein n=1 Tax=Sulfurimonas sp. TaxID=2022749 RepID=UPI0025E0FACF|nr:LTA synthase family protein [Sulfurimonas sp.]MCK9473476.1 LTA synthase family protein [Sulfurimonas sp.]MDD3505324.1 LTA synthase family protein [Sulfurimonas sp.]